MTKKFVLIGTKKENGKVIAQDILGFYTDPVLLYADMEDYSQDGYRFFIGMEQKPALLPPLTDKELEQAMKGN